MSFSHSKREAAADQAQGDADTRRPTHVPVLWQTHSGAHFASENSFSGAVRSPRVYDHFRSSSSRVSTPRKISFASRSLSSDEIAGGGGSVSREARVIVPRLAVSAAATASFLIKASLPNSPNVSGPRRGLRHSQPPRVRSPWLSTGGTSPAMVVPPAPGSACDVADAGSSGVRHVRVSPRCEEAARFPRAWSSPDAQDGCGARWKQSVAYDSTAADWLVAVSEDDMSSTDARGYGCGEGVSRSSSTLSLNSPARLGSAVPALAVADPSAAVPALLPVSAHRHADRSASSASTCATLNTTRPGGSPVSQTVSSGASPQEVNVSLRDVPVPPPAEESRLNHATATGDASQTSFVRAGMEALRTLTEQFRANHASDLGPSDDPTGVRQTCGGCFHAPPSSSTTASTSAPAPLSVPTEATTTVTDALAEAEAALDKAGTVRFSLERFAPFYKLAIKELILECERRVANAPVAERDRQEARFRQTVSVAAAASAVVGPHHALYRSTCGESPVSTHSFDSLWPSATMDLLSTPLPGPRGSTAPGSCAESHDRLQVPTLATDVPSLTQNGTPAMPLAHFPTAEEAARAGFFVAKTSTTAATSCLPFTASAAIGLGGTAGGATGPAAATAVRSCAGAKEAACRPAAVALTEDLTLEALLKALDYYIPYKKAAPMVFIGALAYLSRVAARCVCDYTRITHANWYRLTVVAVLTASKMYNEQSTQKLNRFFATASGIPLPEVKRLEVDFLYLLDFDLLLEDSDVEEWLTWMETLARRHGLFTCLNQFVLGEAEAKNDCGTGGDASVAAEEAPQRAPDAAVDNFTPTRPHRERADPPHHHLRVPSAVSLVDSERGGCSSLLDGHVLSPVYCAVQRRHRCSDTAKCVAAVAALATPASGSAADDGGLGMSGLDDGRAQVASTPRLFSVAHIHDDPPTPPTLRQLSRLASTPTYKTDTNGTAPSPPSPSLFFSRGSRGTSTTGAASSLHRPSHTASTLPRHTNTLAPSSSCANIPVVKAASVSGNSDAPETTTLSTTATNAGSVTKRPATNLYDTAARPPVVPTTNAAGTVTTEKGSGSRWGVMGRVKDVLGATASLVRGQLQILDSPGTRSSPVSGKARAATSSLSSSLGKPSPHGDGVGWHAHGRSPLSAHHAAEHVRQTHVDHHHHHDGALATEVDAADADGYYDEQGCYHLYDDEGFYDDDGYYYFYEDVGYYDEEGNYHYYEDEGYYDEDGNFHFYDEEEDEGEFDDGDADDDDHDDSAFFERCRPPMRLSPPSL